MSTQFFQIPPPDLCWYILIGISESSNLLPVYGELTNTQCDLGYNGDTYTLEIFISKELWVARLLELGIEYLEEGN